MTKSRRLAAAGLVLGLMLSGVLGGCRPQLTWERVLERVRGEFPAVEQLTTEQLAAWIADTERPAPILLDVRQAEEYAVSHLPGARQVSPDADATEIAAVLRGLEPDRPIVAYCSVGYRSSRWLDRLQAADLEAPSGRPLYNLEGSIFRWANEGRPLARAGEPVEVVHPYDARWGVLLDPQRREYTALPADPTER